MSPKTVGVIGGLGSRATVAFLNSVLEHTPIKSNRDHLHMIVDCNPKVPDINAAILGTGPIAAAALAASGRRLEIAGANFIVMVCNAAHVYEGELRQAVSVPFISMVEETMRTIRSDFPQCRRVGLLATDGCFRSNLYQDRLASRDLIPIVQTAKELERLMLALGRINTGDLGHAIRSEILGLIAALIARGAESIILGCSEIALVEPYSDSGIPLIDPGLVLAKATVRSALS
ncbi:Aspartate racemase [Mesorhizobium delmotii]|uniref:Aspartate racemase n=2 Tax=Mesorhizobium delmotii TaxID=1631247 RepID=A0A2P9AW81_9HYPH|nr:amino acid racemase [Mesorhizobium delmotii]SJM35371.1 Aspartate racemase [Mesorhizobium delmotii]